MDTTSTTTSINDIRQLLQKSDELAHEKTAIYTMNNAAYLTFDLVMAYKPMNTGNEAIDRQLRDVRRFVLDEALQITGALHDLYFMLDKYKAKLEKCGVQPVEFTQPVATTEGSELE